MTEASQCCGCYCRSAHHQDTWQRAGVARGRHSHLLSLPSPWLSTLFTHYMLYVYSEGIKAQQCLYNQTKQQSDVNSFFRNHFSLFSFFFQSNKPLFGNSHHKWMSKKPNILSEGIILVQQIMKKTNNSRSVSTFSAKAQPYKYRSFQ